MNLRSIFNKLFFRKHTPGKVVAKSADKVFKKLSAGEAVTPPPHTHEFGPAWKYDNYTHWLECSCTHRIDSASHVDTNGDGKCDTCGYVLPVAPPSHTHEYSANWSYDAYTHWRECSCKESRADIGEHADTNGDGKCDVCGYVMPITPQKPSIPPIIVDANHFNLGLLGLSPGSYVLTVTAEALSLQLAESDHSDPVEYTVNN